MSSSLQSRPYHHGLGLPRVRLQRDASVHAVSSPVLLAQLHDFPFQNLGHGQLVYTPYVTQSIGKKVQNFVLCFRLVLNNT